MAVRRIEAKRGPERRSGLRAVQRLDKEASGLVVFARTVPTQRLETEGQLDRLRAMSCDYGQGYLLSHALDAEGIETFLERAGLWSGPLARGGAAGLHA